MTYLVNGGVRLRVGDWGSAPQAIVLIHGWKQSHRLWDPAVRLLRDRGHHVVAYDLRGMGESDKPDARYDFDEHADDLSAVIDQLRLDHVTLVGWSMGCTVALRHLQRGDARVRGLALVSGPLRLTRSPAYPFGMSEERLGALLAELADGWPAAERRLNEEYLRVPRPELVDWMTQIALQTPLPVATAAVSEQARLDLTSVLDDLAIPVAALYGRHDAHWPPELAHYIAERTGGTARIFEESAHCAPLEQPVAFASAVEALHRSTFDRAGSSARTII